MSERKLRCPERLCGKEAATTRRGPIRIPCLSCALEGRGVVWMVADPDARAAASQPEPERKAQAAPPITMAAAETAFRWSCERDGHVYVGAGACGWCGARAKSDPASGSELSKLQAAQAAGEAS